MSIRVNGVEISDRAVNKELQYHPSSTLEEARAKAARALVVRELLLQAADRLGISDIVPVADPRTGRRETSEEAVIRTLIEREVAIPVPDEAACRRYYDNNRRRFRTEDLFEAAHILFLAHPDDEEATMQAREKAAATLARLAEAPGSFATLAAELSECSSGAQGGNLGQLARGQTVPEFETFLLNLEVGQICPVPVKTRFGYHVLRLDRRIDGHELPFDAVKDRIKAYLREHVWRQAVSQYLKLLAGEAEIEGIEIEGATSLLVQ